MVLVDQILALIWGEKTNPDLLKVTLSYAQTLDGSIALRRGSALSISGPESMRLTHQLRANHQAIMIGIGTVLADNPHLTVRLVKGPHPQPILLDSNLRIPLWANLLHNPCPPWIITTESADREKAAILESKGARLFTLPTTTGGKINLPKLMKLLKDLQVKSLMIEGGATLITNVLADQLADGLVLTITPFFCGGLHAIERPMVTGETLANKNAAFGLPGLEKPYSAQLGQDLIVWGKLKWGG